MCSSLSTNWRTGQRCSEAQFVGGSSLVVAVRQWLAMLPWTCASCLLMLGYSAAQMTTKQATWQVDAMRQTMAQQLCSQRGNALPCPAFRAPHDFLTCDEVVFINLFGATSFVAVQVNV
jgi:hypothetical protein